MDRREFVAGMATLAVAGDVMADANNERLPRGGGVGPEWSGTRALAGGKGYAAGPLGQIHYRSVGPEGRTPFLLIHQTPIGMAEYVDVQPALAQGGRRSIVADNPGYGFSDPVERAVTVAELADHLVALCDALRVPKAIVVGHHTGAAVAAAFAARHPARTSGLVLHGTPLYSAEERAERLARPSPPIVLKDDGSHLSETYRAIGRHVGLDSQTLSSVTWATIGALLAGATSPVYRAIFANDMAPDLKAVRAPTLVLTDTADTLHANDRRAVELRPDFELRTFSDGGSFALMREPERWARTMLEFAAKHAL
jgi:pimeloyl-ACP methyl ester carboxylesterase